MDLLVRFADGASYFDAAGPGSRCSSTCPPRPTSFPRRFATATRRFRGARSAPPATSLCTTTGTSTSGSSGRCCTRSSPGWSISWASSWTDRAALLEPQRRTLRLAPKRPTLPSKHDRGAARTAPLRPPRRPSPGAAGRDLATLTAPGTRPPQSLRTVRTSQALAAGRTCYDNLAGRLGVAPLDGMASRGVRRRPAGGGWGMLLPAQHPPGRTRQFEAPGPGSVTR